MFYYFFVLIKIVWVFEWVLKFYIFSKKILKVISVIDILKRLSKYFKIYSCIFFFLHFFLVFINQNIVILLSGYKNFWVRLYYLCHVKKQILTKVIYMLCDIQNI